MVISNMDFPFLGHSLLVITWIICLATSSSTWPKAESSHIIRVSSSRLVRGVWHFVDDCHVAVLAPPLRWTLHALLNGSILRAPFNVVVSNVENVLGVTSGHYDKQLVYSRCNFFPDIINCNMDLNEP
jgi:hypothetical protein